MPVHVFLTVDTEVSPKTNGWLASSLKDEIRWDIYGETRHGDFGLAYQMDVLEKHGLKGVFFIEALFPCAVGLDPLRQIVELIQSRGHEVQLHVHAEWAKRTPEPLVPGRSGKHLKDFTEDEQFQLISRALEYLNAAGANHVCAFRAGNYGADFATLRTLRRLGIAYDTSYNLPYLGSRCGLCTAEPVLQPRVIEGVWEFPITYFYDLPGHVRHLQLTACSFPEMKAVLQQAWELRWYSVVLVSHSFELVGPRSPGRPVLPDYLVIRRFERVCQFLDTNRDKFQTTTFDEVDPAEIAGTGTGPPIRTSVWSTAFRMVEQVGRALRA